MIFTVFSSCPLPFLASVFGDAISLIVPVPVPVPDPVDATAPDEFGSGNGGDNPSPKLPSSTVGILELTAKMKEAGSNPDDHWKSDEPEPGGMNCSTWRWASRAERMTAS